ncbi:MAG: hypothetical protein ACKOKB_08410 [Bacteroidota bacterium]
MSSVQYLDLPLVDIAIYQILRFKFESYFSLVFFHFLFAQKVTKKGTTNANRLIGLVAQGYTPGPTNLTVRTVRGQATRLWIGIFVLRFKISNWYKLLIKQQRWLSK